MSDIAITQIVLLVTTILGLVWQAYRDNQTRRWRIEDREYSERKREELHQKIDKQTEHTTTIINDRISAEARQVTRDLLTICERTPLNIRRDDIATLLRTRHQQTRTGESERRRKGNGSIEHDES